MGTIYFAFVFGICLLVQSNTGQLLQEEELRNEKSCSTVLNISCSSSEIIAVHSLYFFYDFDCSNTCCSFNSSHTSIGAEESDIQEIRRICSGRESCSSRFERVRDFGSSGLQTHSYVIAHYYCIAGSRVNTVCSNKEVMSQGRQPLYLTNKNYPSVTTGNSTCSCSLEINSCSSDIQLNVLDLDLYLDTVTCEQSLEFINNKDNELKRINCESYYNNSITSMTLNSHYIRINFIDNSTQDQEGYFLLGFKATDEHVTFSISCPYKQESICLNCEDTFSISNGYVQARDNNTGNGSLADVNCDTGYETVKPYVRCLETGHWENASCSPKDCGSLPKIADGEYYLVDVNNITYGAVATVSCSEGYESDTPSITCLESGQWTSALCTAKDCRGTPSIDNGKISSNATFFGAVATLTCDTGYNASVNRIKCLSSGKWETATCTIKDCGNPTAIKNGEIVLLKAGKTTYNSSAKVTCKEGYNAMKQVVKCDKTGSWESSFCKQKEENLHQTDDAGSSSTTLIVLLVLLVLGIIAVAVFLIWKFRNRLGIVIGSKGNERISFKNEEVIPIPEDQGHQNLNISFMNEGDVSKDQQCEDPNASSKNEDIPQDIPMVQQSQDSNIDVQNDVKTDEADAMQEKQQSQDSNVAVKTDEVLPEETKNQESAVDVKTDEALPEEQKHEGSNVAVKTDEVLPEKPPSQELTDAAKTDESLLEKQPAQELNDAVKTDADLQEKKSNVDVTTEKDMPENQPDSKVSAPDDEIIENEPSQNSNVATENEEKEKLVQS